MDLKDFVKINPDKVRNDEKLMRLFIFFYEGVFLSKPKCVGCVFKSGFLKLKKHVLNNNNLELNKKNTMDEKSFILKPYFRTKILTYKKNDVVYRCYGYNLTEEHAINLFNLGRTDIFIKEPKNNTQEIINLNDEKIESRFYSMDYRGEVLPLYTKYKEETGLKAKSNKKDDIISFLEKHES